MLSDETGCIIVCERRANIFLNLFPNLTVYSKILLFNSNHTYARAITFANVTNHKNGTRERKNKRRRLALLTSQYPATLSPWDHWPLTNKGL